MSNDIAKKAYLGSVIVPPRYTVDDTPTEGSTNLVTSGGVYDALADVKERLLVHVDFIELLNTGTGTADATAAEIYEASKSKDVLLVAGVEHEGGELIDGATLTLGWATSEFAVFSMVEPASGEPISTAAITYYVTIKADGTAVAGYAQSAIPQVIITVNASTGKADIKPGEIYNRYGVVPVFVIDNHYTGAYGVYPYLPVTCITPTDIWYGDMVKTDSNGVNYYSVGHIDSTGNVTHETISLVSQGTAPEPLVVTTSRLVPSQGEAYDKASSTAAEIIAALEAGRPVYVESVGAILRYIPVTWTTSINNVAQVACIAVNAGTREMSLELKQLKQCYIVDDHISFSTIDLTKIHDAPLIVTVTESDGSYASDKTYAEIAAAHEAGRVVESRYAPTQSQSLVYRLAKIDPSAEQAYFTTIEPSTPTVYIVRQIGIAATGSVAVTQARVTTQS